MNRLTMQQIDDAAAALQAGTEVDTSQTHFVSGERGVTCVGSISLAGFFMMLNRYGPGKFRVQPHG